MNKGGGNTVKEYLKSRATEPSTWRGLIMLFGALAGYTLDEAVSESLITVFTAMAASGFAGVFTKG